MAVMAQPFEVQEAGQDPPPEGKNKITILGHSTGPNDKYLTVTQVREIVPDLPKKPKGLVKDRQDVNVDTQVAHFNQGTKKGGAVDTWIFLCALPLIFQYIEGDATSPPAVDAIQVMNYIKGLAALTQMEIITQSMLCTVPIGDIGDGIMMIPLNLLLLLTTSIYECPTSPDGPSFGKMLVDSVKTIVKKTQEVPVKYQATIMVSIAATVHEITATKLSGQFYTSEHYLPIVKAVCKRCSIIVVYMTDEYTYIPSMLALEVMNACFEEWKTLPYHTVGNLMQHAISRLLKQFQENIFYIHTVQEWIMVARDVYDRSIQLQDDDTLTDDDMDVDDRSDEINDLKAQIEALNEQLKKAQEELDGSVPAEEADRLQKRIDDITKELDSTNKKCVFMGQCLEFSVNRVNEMTTTSKNLQISVNNTMYSQPVKLSRRVCNVPDARAPRTEVTIPMKDHVKKDYVYINIPGDDPFEKLAHVFNHQDSMASVVLGCHKPTNAEDPVMKGLEISIKNGQDCYKHSVDTMEVTDMVERLDKKDKENDHFGMVLMVLHLILTDQVNVPNKDEIVSNMKGNTVKLLKKEAEMKFMLMHHAQGRGNAMEVEDFHAPPPEHHG